MNTEQLVGSLVFLVQVVMLTLFLRQLSSKCMKISIMQQGERETERQSESYDSRKAMFIDLFLSLFATVIAHIEIFFFK